MSNVPDAEVGERRGRAAAGEISPVAGVGGGDVRPGTVHDQGAARVDQADIEVVAVYDLPANRPAVGDAQGAPLLSSGPPEVLTIPPTTFSVLVLAMLRLPPVQLRVEPGEKVALPLKLSEPDWRLTVVVPLNEDVPELVSPPPLTLTIVVPRPDWND